MLCCFVNILLADIHRVLTIMHFVSLQIYRECLLLLFLMDCEGQLEEENTVNNVVRETVASQPNMVALLLRLHFHDHDCFVQVLLSFLISIK